MSIRDLVRAAAGRVVAFFRVRRARAVAAAFRVRLADADASEDARMWAAEDALRAAELVAVDIDAPPLDDWYRCPRCGDEVCADGCGGGCAQGRGGALP